MLADVYNKENKKVEQIDLPEKICNAKWNPSLIHQAFVAQLSNARKPSAHTKSRAEVRGGGRKPWRQKHTGRARHGSTRSPIWVGGGITFGPSNERNFSKKINKKMKQKALFSLLSKKLKDKELLFLNEIKAENKKTKSIAVVLKTIFKKAINVLIIPAKENKEAFLSGRNIKNVKVLSPESLNIYDCLKYKYIVLEKDAVSQITKHYTD